MVSQSLVLPSLNRLRALIKKEIIHIFSEKGTYLVALIFPGMLLILFGMGINLDPGHIDLALRYPANDRPHYAQFAPLIFSNSFGNVTLESMPALNAKIQTNQLRAFLFLDEAVNCLIDGSDTNTANIFAGTVSGVLQEDKQQQGLAMALKVQPLIRLIPRSWYNPRLETQWTLVPGSIAVIMTLVSTLLTSLVLAKEYEKGMIESLYVTPLSIFELYMSKWIPYFILSLCVLMGSMTFAVLFYQIPMRGSLGLFTLSSVCFLYAAVNMGLCISLTFKDQFICSQLALMSAYMPSFMLSGFLFELTSMPEPIQFLSYFVAARYFVPALQMIFLGGGSLTMIAKNCVGLLLLGTFWGFLSWRQLHQRTLFS